MKEPAPEQHRSSGRTGLLKALSARLWPAPSDAPAAPPGRRGLLRAVLLVATAVALSFSTLACASIDVPPPGSEEERRVIEQGREIDRQIEAQFGFYEDAELAAYVQRVGNDVAGESEWPGLPWQFQVLDSPVVNAFAVPGGYIYVTRGLLAHMNSEAELAGVLGHEAAHVTGRHSAEQQRRSTFAGLGLVLGSILAPEGVAAPLLESGIAQGALGLFLLRYSRSQELEADEVGIGYAVRAGYDPGGISDFFHTLQELERRSDGRPVPGWASTHPEVDDRIERGRQFADQALAAAGVQASALTVGATTHLQSVNGIVFGEDPRQGYTDGNDFLHPELRFALSFPVGWSIQNGRAVVVSPAPGEDAVIQLSLARPAEGETAEEHVEHFLQQIDAAVVSSNRTRVDGLPALQVVFEAASGGVRYRVMALWVEYDGRLYELMGVTTPGDYRDYERVFRRALFSFRELTDPAALDVEPDRIDVRRVGSTTRLAAYIEAQRGTAAPPDTIALINGKDLQSELAADSLIKLVVQGRAANPVTGRVRSHPEQENRR